jgi:DNA-binding XRE family transcriptional regulator
MFRAARALVDLEQNELATRLRVDRRTIIRIEIEGPTENPRRLQTCIQIRDLLESKYGVIFVYPNDSTGEGVLMKKGK